MTIYINGREVYFTGSQISYAAAVKLAGMNGTPSVTYQGRRKGDSRRSGSMHPGCASVELETGMQFNVAHTGSA